jgi:predicted DNA-binding protein
MKHYSQLPVSSHPQRGLGSAVFWNRVLKGHDFSRSARKSAVNLYKRRAIPMVELQMEPEAEALLDRFAAQAGQTKAEFVRRAVLDCLEDREDYEAGIAALKESKGQPTFSLEEVVKSLDLESKFSRQSAKATPQPGRIRAKANPQVRERKASRVA